MAPISRWVGVRRDGKDACARAPVSLYIIGRARPDADSIPLPGRAVIGRARHGARAWFASYHDAITRSPSESAPPSWCVISSIVPADAPASTVKSTKICAVAGAQVPGAAKLSRSIEPAIASAYWSSTARPLSVDARANPGPARRALKAHWIDVGRDRLLRGDAGQFSFNLFTVSRADLARLRAMQIEHSEAMRSVIAASAPGECVGVANLPLFELVGDG